MDEPTTVERDAATTSSYYCDREWHNGAKVHADYSIIEIAQINYTSNSKIDAQAKMHGFHFACCRVHLETAIHVAMVKGAHNLSIREVNQ